MRRALHLCLAVEIWSAAGLLIPSTAVGQTTATEAAALTQHYNGNNGFNGNGWHTLALGDNGTWNVNYDRLYLRRGDGTYTNQIKVSLADHAYYLDSAGLYYQGGSVGIGTTNPGDYRLAVNGPIRTTEVVVQSGWADYVFEPGYRLKPLSEVGAYITEHRRLPDMPSAAEVQEKGVGLGNVQAKLLAKIEELTLHLIRMDETVRRLERENGDLKARLMLPEGDAVRERKVEP